MKSPLLEEESNSEIFCRRGFKIAAEAFNKAINAGHNDLMVFCHQDMMFPAGWLDTFSRQIGQLEQIDPNWGVVGCAGFTFDNRVAAHVFRHDRELRGVVPLPARVRTLDECIIAFRRSSGLRFDEKLAGFFFYAVDVCMQAEVRGLNNYAVDAPCFHQAKSRSFLPMSFFNAEQKIIRKWKNHLPIQTLSGRVTGEGNLAYKKLRNRWHWLLTILGHPRESWWIHLPKIHRDSFLQ